MKVLFALSGWFLWNFGTFALAKNKDEELHRNFPVKQYFIETWEDWVGSLICCLVLFLVMILGYGVDVLQLTGLKVAWTDAFIGASGAAWQILLSVIRKVKGSTSPPTPPAV